MLWLTSCLGEGTVGYISGRPSKGGWFIDSQFFSSKVSPPLDTDIGMIGMIATVW